MSKKFVKSVTMDDIIRKAEEYFKELDLTGEQPKLGEFGLRIGANTHTLKNWYRGSFDSGDGKGERPYQQWTQEDIERFRAVYDELTLRFEAYAEGKLYNKDSANGAKFALERRAGWIEQTESKITSDGSVKVVLGDAEKYAK